MASRREPPLTQAEIGDALSALERVEGVCCDPSEPPMKVVIESDCKIISTVLHRMLTDVLDRARLK